MIDLKGLLAWQARWDWDSDTLFLESDQLTHTITYHPTRETGSGLEVRLGILTSKTAHDSLAVYWEEAAAGYRELVPVWLDHLEAMGVDPLAAEVLTAATLEEWRACGDLLVPYFTPTGPSFLSTPYLEAAELELMGRLEEWSHEWPGLLSSQVRA